MADISKINAVALANIAKLDAVLAANIAKVNGLVFTTAGISAPAAAYSVRLLDSALGVPTYTGAAMRVRRDTGGGTGDDDEADIAFDSGIVSLDSAISNASVGVTATTLGQFLNVGTVNGTTYTNPDSLTVTASCFVNEWKDQSGNANDAEQATEASQPQIHDGTVNTDLITENGKPALDFDGSNDTLRCAAAFSEVNYLSAVYENNDTATFRTLLGADATTTVYGSFYFQSSNTPTRKGGFLRKSRTTPVTDYEVVMSSAVATGTQILQTGYITGTTIAVAQNGTLETGTIDTNDLTTIGGQQNGQAQIGAGYYSNNLVDFTNSKIQELIVYDSDQSSNRSGIEGNVNSEYLIYQPTDAPTSGLLATYTGAAAAYSVRQLSDKAVIALRIRRDMGTGNPGDDDETNIGWDANGDLDTQAIADFCGTGTGYVTRWWDQSVNGNHADQDAQGSQPQIYNGTAVITENGKPALQFAQDGFDPISGSKSDILFHTSTQGMLYNVGNYTASQNGLRIIAETNGTSSSKSGFVFAIDDRAATGSNDYGYYSLSKGTGAGNAIIGTGEASFVGAQYLMAIHYDFGSGIFQYQNGSLLDSVANPLTYGTGDATNDLAIGNIAGNYTYSLVGTMQELILYNDDDTNRTGIETNINDYYSIY